MDMSLLIFNIISRDISFAMDREYNFIIFSEVLYGDKFYYNAALKKKLPFPHQFLYIINNFGEGGNSCKLNIDCKLV